MALNVAARVTNKEAQFQDQINVKLLCLRRGSIIFSGLFNKNISGLLIAVSPKFFFATRVLILVLQFSVLISIAVNLIESSALAIKAERYLMLI